MQNNNPLHVSNGSKSAEGISKKSMIKIGTWATVPALCAMAFGGAVTANATSQPVTTQDKGIEAQVPENFKPNPKDLAVFEGDFETRTADVVIPASFSKKLGTTNESDRNEVSYIKSVTKAQKAKAAAAKKLADEKKAKAAAEKKVAEAREAAEARKAAAAKKLADKKAAEKAALKKAEAKKAAAKAAAEKAALAKAEAAKRAEVPIVVKTSNEGAAAGGDLNTAIKTTAVSETAKEKAAKDERTKKIQAMIQAASGGSTANQVLPGSNPVTSAPTVVIPGATNTTENPTVANTGTLPAGVPSTPETEYAFSYLKTQGYSNPEAEMVALYKLWTRESNWDSTAYNASSGATGIPQSLPGNKMASEGADWATNPQTQIRWGLKYIKQVYGSPVNAWAHSESVGWY